MNRTVRVVAGALAASALSVFVLPSVLMPSVAGASGGSASVTVELTSAQPNPGDVKVSDLTGTTIYGTCAGLSMPGMATCSVPIPAKSDVLLVGQPSAGEQVTAWTKTCEGSPGPVCHIESGGTGYSKKIVVTVGPATAGTPTVTTSQPSLDGSAPNDCDPDQSVTVSGSGFPADTSVTLSDDGNVVASGTTDGNGKAQLTDGPGGSEPGIYRTLAMSAGGKSATTDVFNAAYVCLAISTTPHPTGTISATVDASGLDANSNDVAIRFKGNQLTPIDANSTGAGTATTPYYTCKLGKTYTAHVSGTRGIGTEQQYTFVYAFMATC